MSAHNARITEQSIAALDARTALAELAIPCADVAAWAEASPEYQSTPHDHPLRRLLRAFDRIAAKFKGTGLALEPQAIVEQKKSERRHLEWHDRIWQHGADVDAGPWSKLDAAIKSWRVFVGIPADGFKRSTNAER